MSEELCQVVLHMKHGDSVTGRIGPADIREVADAVGGNLPKDKGFMTLDLTDGSTIVVPNREITSVLIRPVLQRDNDD